MNRRVTLFLLLFSSLLLVSCQKKQKYELTTPPKELRAAIQKRQSQVKEQTFEEFPIRAVANYRLAPGQVAIDQVGRRGESLVTFSITFQEDREVYRKPLSEQVIRRAQAMLLQFGPRFDSDIQDGERFLLGYSQPSQSVDLEALLIHAGLLDQMTIVDLTDNGEILLGGVLLPGRTQPETTSRKKPTRRSSTSAESGESDDSLPPPTSASTPSSQGRPPQESSQGSPTPAPPESAPEEAEESAPLLVPSQTDAP